MKKGKEKKEQRIVLVEPDRGRAQDSRYWTPGDSLSVEDLQMLRVVQRFYEREGFPPNKRQVPNTSALKSRFRTWKAVLEAAGVPPMNDPECNRRRTENKEWKKRMNSL